MTVDQIVDQVINELNSKITWVVAIDSTQLLQVIVTTLGKAFKNAGNNHHSLYKKLSLKFHPDKLDSINQPFVKILKSHKRESVLQQQLVNFKDNLNSKSNDYSSKPNFYTSDPNYSNGGSSNYDAKAWAETILVVAGVTTLISAAIMAVEFYFLKTPLMFMLIPSAAVVALQLLEIALTVSMRWIAKQGLIKESTANSFNKNMANSLVCLRPLVVCYMDSLNPTVCGLVVAFITDVAFESLKAVFSEFDEYAYKHTEAPKNAKPNTNFKPSPTQDNSAKPDASQQKTSMPSPKSEAENSNAGQKRARSGGFFNRCFGRHDDMTNGNEAQSTAGASL